MKASQEIMEALHSRLADKFNAALDDPDVSPATLAAAAKFLKDNGVYGFDVSDKKINDLAERLQTMISEDEGLSEATDHIFSS